MDAVLIIAPKYSADSAAPYLTDDLASALVRRGCRVTALGYGQRNVRRISEGGNLREVVLRVRTGPKYLKWVAVWYRLRVVMKQLLAKNKFTRLVAFSPLTVLWPAMVGISPHGYRISTCVVFDLYPEHQVQIGALPRWLGAPLLRLEARLLGGFSEITGMTQGNLRAIKQLYGEPIRACRFKVLPPWGYSQVASSLPRVGKRQSGPRTVRLVYGGQICRGRAFGEALAILGLVRNRGLEVRLAVYTDKQGARTLSKLGLLPAWVDVHGLLPRTEYLTELRSYEVGLVVTDPSVTLPTFPSKIVDYLSAGLRCLCLIEEASDIESVLPLPNTIHINRFRLDHDAVGAAERFLAEDDADRHSELAMAARLLSADAAAKVVLA